MTDDRSFIAGGLGACLAKTATAPLARVTILLQTETLSVPVKRPEFILQGDGNYYYSYRSSVQPSLPKALKLLTRSEGIIGLWRGNAASCIHRFPYSGMTFLVHGSLKKNGYSELTAGAFAGGVAATVAYPLDVVKTRMATNRRFRSVLDTLASIMKEEGFTGCYRGLMPTLVYTMPSFAISFWVYAQSKQLLNDKHSLIPTPLLAGAFSGFASAALLYPVDLVRRRMQLQGTLPLNDCLRKIVQTDGFLGFYRGLPAELAKVVPYVSALFFAVEKLKQVL